ncbi:MAG: YbdK family carboxylate-amine ligase [Phycisphaerales bacterium]|nr:YbdK family carboxylate-amine ligase [Phycisphaerales bacterium]
MTTNSDRPTLTFTPSPEPTIGVELEVPIVDRSTRELVPGSARILSACAEEGIDGVSAELMQSMLEVRTDVCADVAAIRDQLVTKLRRVRNVANSTGYDLGLLASHPSARPNDHTVVPAEHYLKLQGRMAWMVYHRVTFGLHVHVGVRSGDEAIGLINLMVQYLPHLIAASANSPFWQGVDTGLASSRCALYNLVTHAGVPQYFTDWKSFRRYCRIMQECGALRSVTCLKWDIRPRPDFGTIEVRACDTPATLRDVLGLAALIRTLTIANQSLLKEKPATRRGDIRRQWITAENRWLATRFGLDAILIRTPGGKRRILRQDLADLVERLLPVAAASGDAAFLRHLGATHESHTGAARQRRVYRDTGRWEAVVDDAVRRLDDGLRDRAAPAAAARG